MLQSRMASDSRKLMAEKDQQVPLLAWFLMEVIGAALTVVNWNSGRLGAGRCWADAEAHRHSYAAEMRRILFIVILNYWFQSCKDNKRMERLEPRGHARKP